MPDVSNTQLIVAGIGPLGVSFVVFLLVQALKDFAPGIRDGKAIAALYLLSLPVAVAVVYLARPDWTDPMTAVAISVWEILLSQMAKGYYADLFKVSLQGVPPGPDAEVPLSAVAPEWRTRDPKTGQYVSKPRARTRAQKGNAP